jgi:WD40 repeat protein
MALSNSGKYLAAGCADKHLRVYLLYDSDSSDDIIPEMIFEEKLDD